MSGMPPHVILSAWENDAAERAPHNAKVQSWGIGTPGEPCIAIAVREVERLKALNARLADLLRRYATTECPTCTGHGTVEYREDGNNPPCPACGGGCYVLPDEVKNLLKETTP